MDGEGQAAKGTRRATTLNAMRTLLLALLASLMLPATGAAAAERGLYVSLGDSYATGAQVVPGVGLRNTSEGFADQIPALARERGYRLKLVNLGCGGETSSSLLDRVAVCRGPAIGGREYPGISQIAAAERFLRRHRGQVRLVTISIGGNDVTACPSAPDPIACVAGATRAVEENVTEIARRVRKAAGPRARIVGTTYPDVILGLWRENETLARLSVVAFKDLINPALRRAYAAAGGRLVDVTAKSGAYGPLDAIDPASGLPVPVARVCALTYYCSHRDIHANTAGYALIARLVARTLPRR